ncbi:MAG: hypothetical protein HY262_00425 [Chloroflexi bacterium]|nr:hypothetical protein [Chloroflexota bacterium]
MTFGTDRRAVDHQPLDGSLDDRMDGLPSGLTPVAVVGTLAEFRSEPTPYDLAALVDFVRTIGPDLLCLDMTLEQWQRRDFGGLPPEYRDALLPLAQQTDIVVVPIGDDAQPGGSTAVDGTTGVPAGPRRWLFDRLRAAVGSLQRGAESPVAVDRGARHWMAELLYHLMDWLSGGSSAHRGPTTSHGAIAHREALAERVAELAGRDTGRRILVVVNARYCHYLRRALGRHPEVRLVRYADL